MSTSELTVTPWSTVTREYAAGFPDWVKDELDQERLRAYQAYEMMYWSIDRALPIMRAAEDGQPIYLPKPKTVVDTTAHFLLKGLQIAVEGGDESLKQVLQDFLDRESFLARFNVAKLKGVCLGDWFWHITADPDQPEGKRLSLSTIDPAAVFPEYHPDDMQTVVGIKIVDTWPHPSDETKTVLKILRYWYNYEDPTDTLIYREEHLWEMEGWNNPEKAVLVKVLLEPAALPPEITQIPVYHFKNADWDGNLFGNSELKGVERVLQGLDQAISDEEIALALVGLGVYATDAGRPKQNGKDVDWVIAPGTVLEVPGATMIKRLEGITSVTPVQDHLEYLGESLFEATQTSDIALGKVDAQVAESGIALALRFLPTAAKLEYRDEQGLATLTQMLYDLRAWFKAYEGVDFGEARIVPTIGDKLPVNRTKVLDELNQLFDRKIISAEFYRSEAERQLGYVFPKDIAKQILEEQRASLMLMQEFKQPEQGVTSGGNPKTKDNGKADKNQSNNSNKTNESNGTEAGGSN